MDIGKNNIEPAPSRFRELNDRRIRTKKEEELKRSKDSHSKGSFYITIFSRTPLESNKTVSRDPVLIQ